MLHGRRSETLGMSLCYLVYYRSTFSTRTVFISFLLLFVIFTSVEYIRDSSLVNFSYSKVSTQLDGKLRLPGASNVMITFPDLVYLKDTDQLNSEDLFTLDSWFVRLIPTPLVKILFSSDYYLEGHIINKSFLGYIGGVHSFAIFYLNGGILLLCVWSYLLGFITSKFDQFILQKSLTKYFSLLSFIYLFSMFRLHWYHPIGFIKQIIYLFIFSILFIGYLRIYSYRRIESHNKHIY